MRENLKDNNLKLRASGRKTRAKNEISETSKVSENVNDTSITQAPDTTSAAVDMLDLTALMTNLLHARDRTRSALNQVCKANSAVWESGRRTHEFEFSHKQSTKELVEARKAYNKARMEFASALAGFQKGNQAA
jgi:hypothetical protein